MTMQRFASLVVVVSTCLLPFASSQEYVGGPLGNYTEVEAVPAYAFRDGATIVSAMLPFHLEYNSQTRLCSRFNSRMALQYLEAVRLAADLVQNSSLLGNMSVGFKIVDSCSSVDRVSELIKLVETFHQGDSYCPKKCPKVRGSPLPPKYHPGVLKLAIGIESSDLVRATTGIFEEFSLPLVSHAASGHSILGDTRPSYAVFRVVPDEKFEAMAILRLASFFNWTHVGLFTPQTERGMSMLSLLRKEMIGEVNSTVCFGIQKTYSANDPETVQEAAEKIKNVMLINAVILLGDFESSLPFIRAVSDLNAIDRLVWIMTSAWGKYAWNLPLNDPKYQVVAKMKHVFFLQPVPAGKKSVVGESWDSIAKKLQERLQSADQYAQKNSNPWFRKAWSKTGKNDCVDKTDKMLGSGMSDQISPIDVTRNSSQCPTNRKKHEFPLYDSLLLMDAFFHVANVVEGLYKKKNCHMVKIFRCKLVRQILASPDGWFKLSDKQKEEATNFVGVSFFPFWPNFEEASRGLNGLNPDKAEYDIYYAQPQMEAVTAEFWPANIGHWTPSNGTELKNPSEQASAGKLGMGNITSSCPKSCPPGTRQVSTFTAYARSCCWQTCEPCTGRTFTNSPGSPECRKCEKGHVPNMDQTACNIAFLTRKTDPFSSVAAIWFAAIGFSLASLTLVAFYKHRDTFVIKTADYILSMSMLVFHAFSFLSIVLLHIKPSDSACASQVLVVLPWPVFYVGCILVKTNRLRALFRHSSKLSCQRLLLQSNKAQGIVVASIGFVTAVLLLIWAALDAPKIHIVYFEDYVEKVCKLNHDLMGVYFGGTLSLFLASLVLAFLARNLPDDFKESFFLLLSTCGITFFWIFLIPAFYFLTSVQSDILLVLVVTCQGVVTTVFLFTRRLYYIIRPRLEAVMKAHKMLSCISSHRAQSPASVRASESDEEHGPAKNKTLNETPKKKLPAAPVVDEVSTVECPTKPSEANTFEEAFL